MSRILKYVSVSLKKTEWLWTWQWKNMFLSYLKILWNNLVIFNQAYNQEICVLSKNNENKPNRSSHHFLIKIHQNIKISI